MIEQGQQYRGRVTFRSREDQPKASTTKFE
jgi:hypothetical protein